PEQGVRDARADQRGDAAGGARLGRRAVRARAGRRPGEGNEGAGQARRAAGEGCWAGAGSAAARRIRARAEALPRAALRRSEARVRVLAPALSARRTVALVCRAMREDGRGAARGTGGRRVPDGVQMTWFFLHFSTMSQSWPAARAPETSTRWSVGVRRAGRSARAAGDPEGDERGHGRRGPALPALRPRVPQG